jgi:cystathionine gamma-synthase
MEKHCANALVVARHLEQRPEVRAVLYPGLPSHPGHQLASRQMRGFGGMVSLRLAGADAALAFCAATRLFALAVSLGGVESLVEYPARMTHLSAAGSPVSPMADLVRLSVGVEDAEDLVDDLDRALGATH